MSNQFNQNLKQFQIQKMSYYEDKKWQVIQNIAGHYDTAPHFMTLRAALYDTAQYFMILRAAQCCQKSTHQNVKPGSIHQKKLLQMNWTKCEISSKCQKSTQSKCETISKCKNVKSTKKKQVRWRVVHRKGLNPSNIQNLNCGWTGPNASDLPKYQRVSKQSARQHC